MNLEPMRYKNYVWPHNPRTYEIIYDRNIAVHKVPFGRYFLQNLGLTRRILRGEGEFVGAGAYEEFKKLATVFYDEEPGLLVHPVWQVSNAYFASLSLKMEPYEDYVKYAFEFWETYDGYTGKAEKYAAGRKMVAAASAAPQTYTVRAGDTMWGIAQRNGLTLEELVALNPQIRNPNRIYVGDVVFLGQGGESR